jgi:Bacterial Ig-like domain (group 2)
MGKSLSATARAPNIFAGLTASLSRGTLECTVSLGLKTGSPILLALLLVLIIIRSFRTLPDLRSSEPNEPKEGFMIESARGRRDMARLNPGATLKLSAIRYEMWPGPRHALDAGVRWISADPSIATVDAHGVVTAVHVGTTEIFAVCDTCPADPVRKREAEAMHAGDATELGAELVLHSPGAPYATFSIFISSREPSVLPHEPHVSPLDPGIYLAPPCPSRPGQDPACRPKPPEGKSA